MRSSLAACALLGAAQEATPIAEVSAPSRARRNAYSVIAGAPAGAPRRTGKLLGGLGAPVGAQPKGNDYAGCARRPRAAQRRIEMDGAPRPLGAEGQQMRDSRRPRRREASNYAGDCGVRPAPHTRASRLIAVPSAPRRARNGETNEDCWCRGGAPPRTTKKELAGLRAPAARRRTTTNLVGLLARCPRRAPPEETTSRIDGSLAARRRRDKGNRCDCVVASRPRPRGKGRTTLRTSGPRRRRGEEKEQENEARTTRVGELRCTGMS